jgi:hypothetical protein
VFLSDYAGLVATVRAEGWTAQSCAMRLVIGIVLLLLGVGALSCQVDSPAETMPNSTQVASWVRTVDGWERVDSWNTSIALPPGLHPLVVATGQLLISVLALAAIKPSARRVGQGISPPLGRRLIAVNR